MLSAGQINAFKTYSKNVLKTYLCFVKCIYNIFFKHICVCWVCISKTNIWTPVSKPFSNKIAQEAIYPPQFVHISLDCPVCTPCPISLKTHGNVSKGHNILSNNDSHPWFEAFWSQLIYLSKTHKGRIFFKLVVYIYIFFYIFFTSEVSDLMI